MHQKQTQAEDDTTPGQAAPVPSCESQDRILGLESECNRLREQLREKEKALQAAQQEYRPEPCPHPVSNPCGKGMDVTEAPPGHSSSTPYKTAHKALAKYEDLTERSRVQRLKKKHREGKKRFEQALESERAQKQEGPSPVASPRQGPRLFDRFSYLFKTLPIGIDMEGDSLTLIQLKKKSTGFKLVQAARIPGPTDIEPETLGWARWAVDTMKRATTKNGFKSRKVALALPVQNTYIDHLMIPLQKCQDYERKIFEKIRPKLPFRATTDNTIIKYISCTEKRTLAIVLERERVNHCMALCVQAGLEPVLLSVWPIAMANSYKLICPQQEDAFVMLLDVAMERTNLVFCRDASVFYARSIPIGVRDLTIESLIIPLAEQINACRKHFFSLYGHTIDKTIFFASNIADHQTMWKISRQAGLHSQLGDPFDLLETPARRGAAQDQYRPGWSIALGLSMTGHTT
jgi:Tfp pilus assembly PilM family ATPase